MKERPDPSSKPYYRCLNCPRFRSICGGRPTRGMDLKTWCEYMRDVKEHFHLTNAHIAHEADVSIKTIERIMAINCEQDIMRATARRIELVVIGQVGNHTCCADRDESALQERIARLTEEKEYLLQANEDLRKSNEDLRKSNDLMSKVMTRYLEK